MAVTAPSIGVFVRLKLRLTANNLRGRPARIVLFVVGAVLAGMFAVNGYAAFAVPGVLGSVPAAALALPLGGAALVVSWLVLPVVFFGVDESLDPARFALLPVSRRRLIAGLFTAALVGLPALATLAATAGMVDTAARLGGPAAALAEVVGVLTGLLLCVAVSRSVTSAFATGLRSRRARDMATILLAVLAAMVGPLQLLVLAGAQRADWDTVALAARVVAWTPLGAPYSVGLDVVAGRWWAVPVKLVLVLAVAAGLLRWWGATLEAAMVGAVSAGRRQARTPARPPVERLLTAWLPRTRFGALVAREVRYWWRETRRRTALITLSLAGLFLPVSFTVSGVGTGGAVMFIGAIAALALANQFGYDGTAYAANVAAGVPGRVEVQSRAVAHAVFVVPLTAVIAVAVGLLSGRPAAIAGTLGLLLAAYGVGLGLVLPVSVRAAYALPESPNPFAMSSGGGLAKGLLALAVLVGALLATAPLQVAAHFLGPIWPWVGVPVGAGYGLAAYLIGSGVAGDQLDRRMPEVLAAITPNRA